MQKPFANSVSQALLYRFTELGYRFLESPEGSSCITKGVDSVTIPNTVRAHYEFLDYGYVNDGLDSVLEDYCFSLLLNTGLSCIKRYGVAEDIPVYVLQMSNGDNFDKFYSTVLSWGVKQVEISLLLDLILFCLEVENES
jgi:hypothetical protein